MENLQVALTNAARGKRGIRSVERVLADPDKYLADLQDILVTERFVNGPYHIFSLTERGKERTIHSLPFFPDRIVHHAVVQVLSPIWIRSMIRDTYASIPGRGIHDGVRRLQRIIPHCDGHYALKCDISKFYPSVDHDTLKHILRRQIKDPKLLRLLDTIIDSGPGVPIGNYLSQYFGNIILSPFDHWIKETKRVRYYFRYCDDFVIIDGSKQHLHELRREIESELRGYGFSLNPNWQVYPISVHGIDFLGYRFWPDKTLLRKRTIQSLKQRLKVRRPTMSESVRVINATGSFKGWLRYADNRGLVNTLTYPARCRSRRYLGHLRQRLLKAK